jgi:quercetin dioxygenase-like cupin family protein
MEEVLYVLEGEVEYSAAGRRRQAVRGDWVVMPKGVPRSFKIRSGTARMVMLFMPSGFAEYARNPSQPSAQLSADDLQYIARVASQYGIPLGSSAAA